MPPSVNCRKKDCRTKDVRQVDASRIVLTRLRRAGNLDICGSTRIAEPAVDLDERSRGPIPRNASPTVRAAFGKGWAPCNGTCLRLAVGIVPTVPTA
jgi:hypothetical protein